jgi:hypothetical protein
MEKPSSQVSDQNKAFLPSHTATEVEAAKKLSASEPLVNLKPDQVRHISVLANHNQHLEYHTHQM